MSGVTVGTRLDQLIQLRGRLEHEIAQEAHRVATSCRAPRPVLTVPVRRSEPADATSLRELGVDAGTVRAWAREVGLPAGARGRVSLVLISAYAEAHPMQRVNS